MVVTYCTAAQVKSLLQRSTDFDVSSTPTQTEVEAIINRKENYIDRVTGHAWRTITVTDEYAREFICDPLLRNIRIDLMHRKIATLSSGTDKIEIWDGSNFIDYVASKTQGNGPNDEDFFIDKTNGVVFIHDRRTISPKGIRTTYRFGDTAVDLLVEEACIKLTGIDVLNTYEQNLVIPDDGATNKNNIQLRIENWQKDINNILGSLKEFNSL